MAERFTAHEPSQEELAYQAQVLAEVDAELREQGCDVLDDLGARVFTSFSKGRNAGLRRDPVAVVLVRDRTGAGFKRVRLDRVDGNLDDVAHHALLTTPEADRYQKAEAAISRRLRDLGHV